MIQFRRKTLRVEMNQGSGMKMWKLLLVERKSERVSKLDSLVEILAAAFLLEMERIRIVFVNISKAVAMVGTLRVNRRPHTDAARKRFARRAIVEAYVPAYRDEQHQNGHQKGTNFQQALFHAAKIRKIIGHGFLRKIFQKNPGSKNHQLFFHYL